METCSKNMCDNDHRLFQIIIMNLIHISDCETERKTCLLFTKPIGLHLVYKNNTCNPIIILPYCLVATFVINFKNTIEK